MWSPAEIAGLAAQDNLMNMHELAACLSNKHHMFLSYIRDQTNKIATVVQTYGKEEASCLQAQTDVKIDKDFTAAPQVV